METVLTICLGVFTVALACLLLLALCHVASLMTED